MAASTPIVEARSVNRSAANGQILLEDIDLQLSGGDRIAIVGPSGSGKSVLLRTLGALDSADSGQLLWDGQPVPGNRIPAYRAQVQYLRQRPVLFEGTVEQNLQRPFDLAVHSARDYSRESVMRWLAQMGRSEQFLQKQQENLSGGELQMTALLRAIQLAPSVLLLDEPTAALDAEATTAFESLLSQWLTENQGATAWVWVTHSPEQAARMNDQTYHMDSGRLMTTATG